MCRLSGQDRLVEALRNGEDLHKLTARQILGKDDVCKQDRQLAKAVNFGLLFGMDARGFRAYAQLNCNVELSEEQAEHYRSAFFGTYPALRRRHSSSSSAASTPGSNPFTCRIARTRANAFPPHVRASPSGAAFHSKSHKRL